MTDPTKLTDIIDWLERARTKVVAAGLGLANAGYKDAPATDLLRNVVHELNTVKGQLKALAEVRGS